MKKNWTPKEAGLLFSIFVITYFGGTLIVALIASLLGQTLESGSIAQLIINCLLLALLPVSAFILSKKTETSFFDAIKIKNGLTFKTVLKCILLVFLCILAFVPLSVLFTKICNNQSLFDKTVLTMGTKQISIAYYLLSLLITGIITPLCEETAFRGVIVGGLKPIGFCFSVLTGALFFMLMHATPEQTVYQFLMGIVMATVFIKSNSLWAGIIIHALNNIIILTVDFLQSRIVLSGFFYEAIRYLFYDCDFIISIFVAPAALIGIIFLLKSLKPLKEDNAANEFALLKEEEIKKAEQKWKEFKALNINEGYIDNKRELIEKKIAATSKYSLSKKAVYLYALCGLLVTAEMWIETLIRMLI